MPFLPDMHMPHYPCCSHYGAKQTDTQQENVVECAQHMLITLQCN